MNGDDWKPIVGDAMRELNAQSRASFAETTDEENRSAPSMTPEPLPQGADPVQSLIERVQSVVPESAQMGSEPLSTKAEVLAQLYQAEAMRNLVDIQTDILDALHQIADAVKSGFSGM